MSIAEHQTMIGVVVHPLIRPVGNVSATGAIIVSWLGVLTPVLTAIATLMAILWYGVTLYESKTCQEWLGTRRAKKVLGEKVVAQSDARVGLAVAKEAVKAADSLPDKPKS